MIIWLVTLSFVSLWSHLLHFLNFSVVKCLTGFFILKSKPCFVKCFFRDSLYFSCVKTSNKKYNLHSWLCKLVKNKFNLPIIIYSDFFISKIASVSQVGEWIFIAWSNKIAIVKFKGLNVRNNESLLIKHDSFWVVLCNFILKKWIISNRKRYTRYLTQF